MSRLALPGSDIRSRRPPPSSSGWLLIWVAVEVAIIGYSNEPPLQAIYGILGVAIVLVAFRWLLGAGLPRSTERTLRQATVGLHLERPDHP